MSNDQTPNRPSHFAYQINEGQDGKSYFNRVGAAFEHRDGQGFNVVLDAVPVDGRVTLRTPQERLEDVRNEPAPQPRQQVQQQEAKQRPAPERDQGQER